ncbi:hypothetical protein ABZ924_30980 [Streptomyces sp. NPDC046876]|uniref:hypothetical protein n=1 Tax=Streptomyces sp. NPDC046876 TaxID=3155616 RepID=UPI00340FCE01
MGGKERKTWIDAYEDLGRRREKRDPGLLRHVSTADTARYLELLRRAVGDPQLNYLGVSYGLLRIGLGPHGGGHPGPVPRPVRLRPHGPLRFSPGSRKPPATSSTG